MFILSVFTCWMLLKYPLYEFIAIWTSLISGLYNCDDVFRFNCGYFNPQLHHFISSLSLSSCVMCTWVKIIMWGDIDKKMMKIAANNKHFQLDFSVTTNQSMASWWYHLVIWAGLVISIRWLWHVKEMKIFWIYIICEVEGCVALNVSGDLSWI